MRHWKLILVVVFFTIFGLLQKTSADSGIPPLGNSGAPGEQNCSSCHNSFANNTGRGQIAVIGLPRDYVAGMTYNLTVVLADPEATRWGFELAIIDDKGGSIGNLVSDDETLAVVKSQNVGSTSRDYLVPTIAGNFTGRIDNAMWKFTWTAPTQYNGNIAFYAVGVAADGDATPRGDDIYTIIYNLRLFEPKPPVLNFVNPPRGPSTGMTKVTLGGQNFRPGVRVFFDGKDTSAELVNETTLALFTPAHDVGLVDIRITNSDGMTTLFSKAFEYVVPPPPSPSILFTSPSNGPTTGGTSVKLSGSNFQRGARVIFDTREIPATYIDTNFLMITTPLHDPGQIPVTVINPDGQSTQLDMAFTYEGPIPPPMVKLLAPETIISANGAPTTIKWNIDSNGSPFQRLLLSTDGGRSFPVVLASNLSANVKQFNWLPTSDLVTDKARIRLEVVQAEASVSDETTQDVKIVLAPQIDLITPATAKADKSKLLLEIRGQGFNQGATVEMDGIALKITSITSTVIKLKKVPHTVPGYHFIRVRNTNGGVSRTYLFTVAQ